MSNSKFALTVICLTLFARNAAAEDWNGTPAVPQPPVLINTFPTTACCEPLSPAGNYVSVSKLVPAIGGGGLSGVTIKPGASLVDLNEFARSSTVSGLASRITGLESAIPKIINQQRQGVAMGFAMAGVPVPQEDETFAVSANWGTYENEHAFAAGMGIRVKDHLSVNYGVAVPTGSGSVGARAGVRFGW